MHCYNNSRPAIKSSTVLRYWRSRRWNLYENHVWTSVFGACLLLRPVLFTHLATKRSSSQIQASICDAACIYGHTLYYDRRPFAVGIRVVLQLLLFCFRIDMRRSTCAARANSRVQGESLGFCIGWRSTRARRHLAARDMLITNAVGCRSARREQ